MTSPVWHPFTQHGLREPIPQIARAEGASLWTKDGTHFLDAISSWWVTTHGHCHPRIMAAIAEQAGRLDQIIFAGFTHEPAETLAAGLIAMMPEPLAHVFFSDSGSTSVEVALKMALGYWVNRGAPRHRIAVMESSYHGDTIGGMSVGERGVYNRPYQPLLFDVTALPFPAAGAEQATLDALEAACTGDEPLAALIVEPLVLGAGGMRFYGPETLAAMREICMRHNVLFIADEVMTGWGRTGTLLACEQAGVVPDIVCLSKGITGGAVPLAVTLATPEIFDAHYSTDKADMFFHSSSYTANPIACAAACANLDIWREEPVRERIATLTERQALRLAALAEHPAVHGARQAGTITALEVGDANGTYLSAVGPKLAAHFRAQGMLLRPLGNTVYVMPPYCITEAELDAVYAAIASGIDACG
ncbi:adenosylmethionine--8-amino-7-oxononanoate transaminase [Stakelama sediminis]|uniref:Adenosylmethionine-8-amino-7-oxononanoate aminotransferase n=1 Tax=Stakelama sediminis TaxID=463200 RepID=A0A840YVX8_9SPHN|nr:adenosylmethionine--8-amino-7-oxononanoate transaminase [Stakelama sediminis]MBB5717694.1 adenosylmethionine-8-amino-7-oxononanoate aminotransferase [Stakelama sediminis]